MKQMLKVTILGATAAIVAGVALTAQTTPAARPMVLAATSANVSGAGEKIEFFINKWSTDADRDRLTAAWAATPAAPGRGRGAGGRAAGAAAPAAPVAAATPGAPAGTAATPAAAAPPAASAAAPAAAAASPSTAATSAPASPAAAPGGAAAAPAGAPASPAPPAQAAGRGGRGGGRGRGGDAAAAAPRTPEASLLAALRDAPAVGYFWTSEVGGYLIRYAYQLPQPGGGTRMILLTDKRLGAAKDNWRSAAPATANYEFTLIEVRLPAKGDGEGKVSLTGRIAVDSETKSLVLEGYDGLPVTLQRVSARSGS